MDEYDYEHPELNEERTCVYLQESTGPKMADTHDNTPDPDIIEPNKEVVYGYSRSSGMVSDEDEIAARRVEMTANPAYRTATYSKFVLSQGNCHHFKTRGLLELNEKRICDKSLQATDPEMIVTMSMILLQL